MNELLGVICGLSFVLVLLAGVGHGVWLLTAKIVRFVFGAPDTVAAARRKQCPFCERWNPHDVVRCQWCGRVIQGELADELGDLAALRRQLLRLQRAEVIDTAAVQDLLARVKRYEERLTRSGGVQPARPAAAKAEPAPKPALAAPAASPAAGTLPTSPVAPATPPAPAVAGSLASQEPSLALQASMGQEPSLALQASMGQEPSLALQASMGQEPSLALQASIPTEPSLAIEASTAAEPPAEEIVLTLELVEETPPQPTPAVPAEPEPRPALVGQPVLRPQPAVAAAKPAAAKPAAAAKPRTPPAPPPKPRKPWMEVVAEFLEERNIRVAELILVLVGGLLIVGGSAAVVVSFWEQLKDFPYLKFTVFVAIHAAVFGLGLITYHRWNLEITGRGLLMIATLLVPLNFLAMASMSTPDSSWLTPTTLAELLAIGIFIYLVGLASRVFIAGSRWYQVLAVVGNSATVLLIARLAGQGSPEWSVGGLGLLPVAICSVAVVSYLFALPKQTQLNASAVGSLFALLGTAVFPLSVALGLVMARNAPVHSWRGTLQHAAPLLAIAATPLLFAGVTVMRRIGRAKEMGIHRTAGTAIALGSATVMIAGAGLAWPSPAGILAVAVVDAAALAYVAFRFRMPLAHAGTIAAGTVIYLLGFHLAFGHLAWGVTEDTGRQLIQLAVDARSGTALVGLFALLALASEGLAWSGLRRHASIYVGGCAVIGLLSLTLVTAHNWLTGGAKPIDAAVVYAVYGTCSLAMAARWRRHRFTYFGLGLLVGATLWLLWRETGRVLPIWDATLAVESLVMAVAAAVLVRFSGRAAGLPWDAVEKSPGGSSDAARRLVEVYRLPLLYTAQVLAVLTIALAVRTAMQTTHALESIVTAGCVAALCFLTGWGCRSPERTAAGSTLVLAGLCHTLVWNYPGLVERPWAITMLVHATLAWFASATVHWGVRRWLAAKSGDVQKIFVEPLGMSALLTSTLALPILLAAPGADAMGMAAYLAWQAAIWLAIAWNQRWAGLLAGAQAVLCLAAIAATTGWLQAHPWDAATASSGIDTTDPRTLQAYGIGLALLSLGWLVVRLALRANEEVQRWLNPPWPSVDRVVGLAVVVAQFLLVAGHVAVASVQELDKSAAAIGIHEEAVGPSAWLLLGTVAILLVVGLWNRWSTTEVVGALVASITVPYLVAGRFCGDMAVASALRWGLAIGFVVCVAAVWQRQRLGALCRTVGAKLAIDRFGLIGSHAVVLLATALPVLAITVQAAVLRIDHVAPGGPIPGSLFHVDPTASYLVPLLLVMAGLVGLALRELAAGYAFSAGLVAELIVVLGYVLAVITRGGSIGTAETATALALATIVAAVWAIAWLTARRSLDIWREVTATGRVLMRVQLGMGVLGNALLLVPALLALTLDHCGGNTWTIAAGSPWGWGALVLAIGAMAYRQTQTEGRVRPAAAGLIGMVVLGLLACTVRGMLLEAPEWGYRTLMLGWAMYSVFIVAATWWVASLRTLPGAEGPPQALIGAAAGWTVASGILAVLLGLKAAFFHAAYEELLWAAAAIALAAVACATMAVWRRSEGWALAAAPGVNLAASLVVWYWQWSTRDQLLFRDWWVVLVQANIIASAAVAVVWLAARRRLYQLREFTVRNSPMLAFQTSLGVVALVVLLVPAVAGVVSEPARAPAWTTDWAGPAGWAALLLAAAAAGWYVRQVSPRELLHVFGGLGLGAGVLAACLPATWEGRVPADWLGYHILLTAWTTVVVLILGAGMLLRNVRLSVQQDPTAGRTVTEPVVPGSLVLSWVTGIGIVVLGLALIYVDRDAGGPWWSFGAITALSAVAGVLALWRQLSLYIYISGLLVNVAGTVLWFAWGPWDAYSLAMTHVVCFAIGSAMWSLIRLVYRAGQSAVHPDVPFSHFAARAAVVLLSVAAVVLVACDVQGVEHVAADRRGGAATLAAGLALLILLWDGSARFVLPGLYLAGLAAVGLWLDARLLTPQQLAWTATVELAVFAILAALLGECLPRGERLWRALQIPSPRDRWPADWLPAAQSLIAGTVGVLGVWVAMDPVFAGTAHPNVSRLAGRIAAPLATAILLGVAVLSTFRSGPRWRNRWQYAAMGLGLLVLSELGWALLKPDIAVPWLHRSVILMVAAVAMTLLAGLGIGRVLPSSDWAAAGRRSVPALAGLASISLVGVFAQEAYHMAFHDVVPMALPAAIVVSAAILSLAVGCIAFALSPRLDPLGLSDRGRTAYVYAAEALIVLQCVHVRLTIPDLFRTGIIRNYWMLLLIVAAFVAAWLSELFHRRRMPVLSEPLERSAVLLPLAPALAFWFVPRTPQMLPLSGSTPVVWFLAAAFYGFLAFTKRKAWQSTVFTLLSLVAANIGVGVMWYQRDVELFWAHPQIWLIPVGLSILGAEYLNHRRLTAAQIAGIRYLALSLIYIPSGAEYVREIGQSVWLPLALILLSMGGVLAGIVFRIRSFLYLGVASLSLVVVTMVYYAAVDLGRTWILYLCCIVLGAVALGIVAFYEKRREAIHTAVKRFKQWQR